MANFVLIHFPPTKGRTAAEADAFLTARGLILRQVGAYGLPHALRMSVGTEEANRLVVAALGEFLAKRRDAVSLPAPLFNRLALIGVGLIGSSIARAARAQGAVREIVATARSAATRRRVAELGIADQVVETNAAAVARRRSRHRLHSGRRLRRGGAGNRGRILRRARSCPTSARSRAPVDPRHGAASAARACISCRRIRSPAPSIPGPDAGFAELFIGRWCILTPPRRRRSAGASTAARRSGARSAPRSKSCRPSTTISCSRSPATCRTSSPTPSSAPPTNSPQVTRSEVLQILRRRLSRFHPHRGVRSDHVARRVPHQQGRGAGNARHASTRIWPSSPAPSDAATATPCSSISPAPAPSAAASCRSARIPPRPISAAPIRSCRPSRCRGLMRPPTRNDAACSASRT